MGRASRAKQEARRARVEGSASKQRRRLGYPLVILAVVVIGVAVVWFARKPASSPAAPPLTIPEVVDSTTVPDGATTTVVTVPDTTSTTAAP